MKNITDLIVWFFIALLIILVIGNYVAKYNTKDNRILDQHNKEKTEHGKPINEMKVADSVIDIQRSVEANTGHPAVFPVELPKKIIEIFTQSNKLILDPFMGSGTTLRAAKDLNRKAIGIEIEEKYCEIAVQRLKQEVLAL